MGYRSKVAVRTTPRGLELLEAAWDGANPDDPLRRSCSELYTRGDVSTVGWSDVKWNSTFPEVAAVDELLQVDGLDGEPWSFVRVGEEFGDFEELRCEAIDEGNSDLQRYVLYAEGYIEDGDSFLPVVPDFSLREMSMLVLSLYENVAEHDAEFAERTLAGSQLLRDMVDELERQKGDADDGEGE